MFTKLSAFSISFETFDVSSGVYLLIISSAESRLAALSAKLLKDCKVSGFEVCPDISPDDKTSIKNSGINRSNFQLNLPALFK